MQSNQHIQKSLHRPAQLFLTIKKIDFKPYPPPPEKEKKPGDSQWRKTKHSCELKNPPPPRHHNSSSGVFLTLDRILDIAQTMEASESQSRTSNRRGKPVYQRV